MGIIPDIFEGEGIYNDHCADVLISTSRQQESLKPLWTSLLKEHLPGEHDQKTHGPKKAPDKVGGSGKTSKRSAEDIIKSHGYNTDDVALEEEEDFLDVAKKLDEKTLKEFLEMAENDFGDGKLMGVAVDWDTYKDEYSHIYRKIARHQEETLGLDPYGEELLPGGLTVDGGHYEPQEEPDINEFMRNHYPETDYWELTGYILADGAQLDLSGGSRMRAEDHRSIIPTEEAAKRWGWSEDSYGPRGSRGARMHEMMKKARAVRFHHSDGYALIDAEHSLTSAQRSKISGYLRSYKPETVTVDGMNQSDDLEFPSVGAVFKTLESFRPVWTLLLQEHQGPGPHKSGTEQDIHGKGGGGTDSKSSKPKDSKAPLTGNWREEALKKYETWKATKHLTDQLENNLSDLSPELAKKAQEAIKKVAGNMGANALNEMKSVKSLNVYQTPEEVFSQTSQKHQDFLKTTYGEEVTKAIGGFHNASDNSVTVDGLQVNEYEHTEILSHELGHVVDKGASDSIEWSMAWQIEINQDSNPLSTYGKSSQKEGFAEYARLAWTNPQEAQKFTMSWKLFKDLNLVK